MTKMATPPAVQIHQSQQLTQGMDMGRVHRAMAEDADKVAN